MVLHEQSVDSLTVFSPEGRLLNTMQYEDFRQRLHHLIAGGMTGAVVDMSKVDLVNSSGVSMLIAGLKILREAGGDLRLANLTGIAHKVIVTVCGLGRVFQIYESVDEAVASFKAQ